ncbi:nitrous oxide reductase family maturation protein NosD [Saccharococcus sp. Marseille-Q5394]|uniref:nitrous oxide reductase family maturation protein NosD n=1 Tax=Saccharococcus sp. Marseille-Q5394 TaxID=2972778 RepID=UPI0021C7D20A|nr:nitrous oxide reductase family maturation protein NosD [Saccharococcus sp. Marseille-Q5394]
MKRSIIVSLLGFLLLSGHADAQEAENLQQLIDKTPAGSVLELEAATYEGNVVITKPITIKGKKGTVIKGDKTVNVIEVRSQDVTLDTLSIEGSGMSRSSQEEYSAIRVMADGAVMKNLKISDCFHGIYLNKTKHTTISGVTIVGQGTDALGNQGNGIHIARSSDNHIDHSHIEKTRDGIFVEYSNDNVVSDNTMTQTRYGLHYMYSNNNEFKRNNFVDNVGGAAIMHSDHILLADNKFSFNQGSRSFGLIVQTSRDVHVLNNEFHLNQRGLYLEQSTSNIIEGNDFFQNQIGVELWTSSTAHVFVKNSFRKNRIHALTVGGESNNEWFRNGEGNYWNVPMLDFDKDGIGDAPMEYTSALGELVETNELSYLFLLSPAITIYEKANELLTFQKVMAYDKYPLMSNQKYRGYEWALLAAVLALTGWLVYRKKAMKR